jgi:hypothetical protein
VFEGERNLLGQFGFELVWFQSYGNISQNKKYPDILMLDCLHGGS